MASPQNQEALKFSHVLSRLKLEKSNDRGLYLFQLLLYLSFAVLTVDFIYKSINHISYLDRSQCILNRTLPPLLFLIFESFIELGMVVLTGIFISVLVERYFSRYQKYYPQNPMTAFLYASVIPVCACSVIPLLYTMENRLSFRTLITFIIAAPILNPYIIVISFVVLGWKYAVLRIAGSFVLAISAGYVLEIFTRQVTNPEAGGMTTCRAGSCSALAPGLVARTRQIFMQILPYLFLAGVLSLIFELFVPKNILSSYDLNKSITGLASFIIIGIPLYFCNGADVLFLRPLLCNGLAMGTAVAFSLTATAICASSFVMLLRFLGKKQTIVLTLYILLVTFALGVVINAVFYN